MIILPLSKIIISIEDTNSGVKKATGLVREWESLLDVKVVEQLRERHKGVFCFLAFDSEFDSDIFSYIKTGALSAESGDNILILYIVNKIVETLTKVDDDEADSLFEFNNKSSTNQKILAFVFGDKGHFSLPGLLIFDNVSNSNKSIYVPLINKYSNKIDCLRKVVELVGKNYNKSNEGIINKLGVTLSTENIEYQKNVKYSFGECIIMMYKLLLKTKSDLISILF